MLDAPELYAVYRGKVSGVMEYGCFVELTGFRRKAEGLVHLSNITRARAGSAKDVVTKGQECWVKVISVSGQKLGMSMRDVDQATGEDLLQSAGKLLAAGAGGPGPVSALVGLSGIRVKAEDLEDKPRRAAKRLTEHERWVPPTGCTGGGLRSGGAAHLQGCASGVCMLECGWNLSYPDSRPTLEQLPLC